MARWISVTLITALLAACGGAPAPEVGEKTWTAEQLQAFQRFKSDSAQRATVAEAVARSFPAAFNYEQLRITSNDVAPIPQARLIELLGPPAAAFSLVDRPEYLDAGGRPLDFDPRELRILLYDVDCLNVAGVRDGADCSYLEAVVLNERVLRVRLVADRYEEARALLSQPRPAVSPRAATNRLIAEMPLPGWTSMQSAAASELAKSLASDAPGYEFYEHRAGDAIYGRVVSPFHLTKVSERVAVCLATTKDIFMPTTQPDLAGAVVRRDANIQIAVFEPSLEQCEQRYREGGFVTVVGGGLSAAQLAKIHDLFSRRLAAQCDVPAWLTPQGLIAATGGVYAIDVAMSAAGRDRWSFDAHVRFTPARGGAYDALIAISPWGVRLKECTGG